MVIHAERMARKFPALAPAFRQARKRSRKNFLDDARLSKFTERKFFWGYSSIGRASAWHAEGRRFDSDYLHHFTKAAERQLPSPRFFASAQTRGNAFSGNVFRGNRLGRFRGIRLPSLRNRRSGDDSTAEDFAPRTRRRGSPFSDLPTRKRRARRAP